MFFTQNRSLPLAIMASDYPGNFFSSLLHNFEPLSYYLGQFLTWFSTFSDQSYT